jgi:dCTP deaminase
MRISEDPTFRYSESPMLGILTDSQIRELCDGVNPMISPFIDPPAGKPSYGLSSCGYDITLGGKFLVQGPITRGEIFLGALDPLRDNKPNFSVQEVTETITLEGGACILAESVERFQMPEDVSAVCVGKSSYARLGILVNTTLLEPGWSGTLSVCIANVGQMPVRLHVGMGFAQTIFTRLAQRPERVYGEKAAGGGYQNQAGATLQQ